MPVTVGFNTGKKYQIKTNGVFGTCGKEEEEKRNERHLIQKVSYFLLFDFARR